jgi:hypothetical protein
MIQHGLFEPQRKQAEHLDRVASKIEGVILEFCAGRYVIGAPTFRMDDLRKYVMKAVPNTAPDSPSRILRNLRSRGLVRYTVKSRKDSLYSLEVCG